MNNPKTEQEARKPLDEYLQGNEQFKGVVRIVFTAIVCGYAVYYFI